jgi:hypothetical protein
LFIDGEYEQASENREQRIKISQVQTMFLWRFRKGNFNDNQRNDKYGRVEYQYGLLQMSRRLKW